MSRKRSKSKHFDHTTADEELSDPQVASIKKRGKKKKNPVPATSEDEDLQSEQENNLALKSRGLGSRKSKKGVGKPSHGEDELSGAEVRKRSKKKQVSDYEEEEEYRPSRKSKKKKHDDAEKLADIFDQLKDEFEGIGDRSLEEIIREKRSYDKAKREIEKQIDREQREDDGKKRKMKSKYFNKEELSQKDEGEEEEEEKRNSRKSRKSRKDKFKQDDDMFSSEEEKKKDFDSLNPKKKFNEDKPVEEEEQKRQEKQLEKGIMDANRKRIQQKNPDSKSVGSFCCTPIPVMKKGERSKNDLPHHGLNFLRKYL